MKAEDILSLPKEFDFKSTINSLTRDMIYHAREIESGYEVTWDLGDHVASCAYSKKEFHRSLLKGEFVVAQ